VGVVSKRAWLHKERERERQREKQKDRDTAVMQTVVASSDCLVSAGNPYLREGLSTV